MMLCDWEVTVGLTESNVSLWPPARHQLSHNVYDCSESGDIFTFFIKIKTFANSVI